MDGFRFFCGFLLALLLALAGCTVRAKYDDSSWLGLGGTGGTPTTTGTGGTLFDGEDDQPICCVNGPTSPFQGPSYFQFGEPGTLDPCPEPTTEGLTGYQEMKPIEPHTCGACSCSPATCTLPEGTHTNAAKCADADGSMAIPFGPSPAAGWEGMCSEEGALPAGLQCNGVPCIQSLTIPALAVAPCAPESAPTDPPPDPAWARMARECAMDPAAEAGCGEEQVCLPAPPGGLTLCLYVQGDHPTCPADYPARTVFYTAIQDDRGCEACQCAVPADPQCAAILSTFSDSACNSLVVAVLVTADEPTCVDVQSGTALGSAEGWMVTDLPGSCAPSGGAPFGGVQPAEPLTLCCQGDAPPPG